MNGEVIKSFLVSLGFGVDEADLAKFNKAIQSASVRVTALYAGIKVAAAGIFYGISKISEGFEQMGYEYRIIAPAINKALVLRRELLAAYRAAGINITKTVIEAVKFNFALDKTKFALQAIYTSAASKFFPMLTKAMDQFRGRIYANMPKIIALLQRFIQLVFDAFHAISILTDRLWSILERVYEFFLKLDQATDGWSTKILAAVAAWKLLNLSFLATPLGLILTGFIALLALFDDFKTWEEGGKSLFDWLKVAGVIHGLISLFENWFEIIKNIVNYLSILIGMIGKLLTLDLKGFFSDIPKLLSAAFHVLISMGERLVALFRIIWAGTESMEYAIKDKSPYLDTRNFARPDYIDPTRVNNGVNQNVSQQTSITVQASSDANATAKNVLSGQSKVNFDMTRNLKPSNR